MDAHRVQHEERIKNYTTRREKSHRVKMYMLHVDSERFRLEYAVRYPVTFRSETPRNAQKRKVNAMSCVLAHDRCLRQFLSGTELARGLAAVVLHECRFQRRLVRADVHKLSSVTTGGLVDADGSPTIASCRPSPRTGSA